MLATQAFSEILEFAESVKSDEIRTFPEAASIGDTFRQGDMYITLIENLPKGVIASKNPSNQIAIGDTQGSRHCIDELNNVKVYHKNSPGMLEGPIILVKSPIVITHPEHGHVNLPCGTYEITYQKNLDNEEREMRALD